MTIASPLFWLSKISPTIRTGIGRPLKVIVMVSPIDLPVTARKYAGTSTWPGALYQRPLIMP